MRNIVVLIALLLLILTFKVLAAPSYNSTGNPNDTPKGTTIEAIATLETIEYMDGGSSPMPTVECSSGNISHEIGATYGYSGLNAATDISVTPGQTVYHNYAVTHEGNVLDPLASYKFRGRYNYFNGASGWRVQLLAGNPMTFRATLDAGVPYAVSTNFGDNTDMYYQYIVTVTPESGGAPNGSYITIWSTAESTNTPVGKYTGANAYTYCGWGRASDEVIDNVSAPIMTLSRVSTTDAPRTYQGTKHDAVPGSVITFTMTYSNEGAASAESVVLVDKIPDNTNLAHVNTTGTTTNVTIDAAHGSAIGWVVKYSTLTTLTASQTVYGDTTAWSGSNGAAIGILVTSTDAYPGSGTTYVPGTNTPYNAKWIKWEKLYIDSNEDNQKLTWGVTIR